MPWHRCELAPELCVGEVRYATLPHHDAPGMNLANTPHFETSQVQTLLVPNRRYQLLNVGQTGIQHAENFAMVVGGGLRQ